MYTRIMRWYINAYNLTTVPRTSLLLTTPLSSLPANKSHPHLPPPEPHPRIASSPPSKPTYPLSQISDVMSYHDTIHVPLIQKLVGESFPISHARHGTVSSVSTSPDPSNAPVIIFGGKPEDY
ncbi:unnamed protein product [Periconia digitata]|uniref:Uncharacterized protein n=1 Tax=Periconia digitata TaxID=1303443 RepID=A0A9W4XSR0_9PLEO|nr:unnamed protein product [Periconia digitata]